MEKKEIPVTGPEDAQEELTGQDEQHKEETAENIPVAEEVEEVLESEEVHAEEENMKKTKTAAASGTDAEKLSAELGDMKDKYLRLYAEFDNYRKRTMREREDLLKTAAQDTIKAVLPTLDDFERAIKAAKAIDNSSVSEGILLIYEKLLRTLEQQGLKAMESDGEAFNPDLHEALTKVPVPNEAMKGKVIETLEKGYYLRDKIIRYAKVVVGQ